MLHWLLISKLSKMHFACGWHRLSEAELASENERLQRQLSAVMEMRAAEINNDNLRLVNHLTEVSHDSLPPTSH